MNLSEHDEQRLVFLWAAGRPELALMHAIPNGGKRDLRTAARLKAEGVKAGVPDICLPLPAGGFHGLYIELKTNKGRLSSEQEEWIAGLTAAGYRCAVCRGHQEAIRAIEGYLGRDYGFGGHQ